MGLHDVPRGVTVRTGLLVATAQVVVADADVGGVRVRWDLGPGYAVGIHGVDLIRTISAADDASEVTHIFSLDPERSLTALDAGATANLVVYGETVVGALAAGAFYDLELYQWRVPAPILTVQDASYVVSNELGQSGTFQAKAYFAVYEVSDAEFLRIAGVSLSRG